MSLDTALRPVGRRRPGATVLGLPRRLVRQLVRFGAIGVASTLAYVVLYALLRDPVGAYAANVLALVTTAVGNTAANRRLTFGIRGSAGAAADHVQGLIVFGLGLGLTTGALAALHAGVPGADHTVELLVLVVANAVATLLRFVAYRLWIFHDDEPIHEGAPA